MLRTDVSWTLLARLNLLVLRSDRSCRMLLCLGCGHGRGSMRGQQGTQKKAPPGLSITRTTAGGSEHPHSRASATRPHKALSASLPVHRWLVLHHGRKPWHITTWAGARSSLPAAGAPAIVFSPPYKRRCAEKGKPKAAATCSSKTQSTQALVPLTKPSKGSV
jgi:hypothetical protein